MSHSKSSYEYWILSQEEPQLVEGNAKRYKPLKQPTPKWMEQRKAIDEMRAEMGEEKFHEMEREFREREIQRLKYENND